MNRKHDQPLSTDAKGEVESDGGKHAKGSACKGHGKLNHYLLCGIAGFTTGVLMALFFLLVKEFM